MPFFVASTSSLFDGRYVVLGHNASGVLSINSKHFPLVGLYPYLNVTVLYVATGLFLCCTVSGLSDRFSVAIFEARQRRPRRV